MATTPTPAPTPAASTALPAEVQALIAQLGTLKVSFAIDCPPIDAMIALEGQFFAAMTPAAQQTITGDMADFYHRIYVSIVTPALNAIGVKA